MYVVKRCSDENRRGTRWGIEVQQNQVVEMMKTNGRSCQEIKKSELIRKKDGAFKAQRLAACVSFLRAAASTAVLVSPQFG